MGTLGEPPLVETCVIPDIFASGLAYIEDIGSGCVRYVMYANEGDHRVVVARIVMSAKDALIANAAVRHSFYRGIARTH